VQYYFPLSSDKAITAWVPLQPTPADMGPLQFAAGSHTVDVGRHLGISGTNQYIIDQVPVARCFRQFVQRRGALHPAPARVVCLPISVASVSAGWTCYIFSAPADRRSQCSVQRIGQGGFDIVGDPFEFGEVSFHSGWTFHRADGNATSVPREVFTIIYIDEVRTL